jgi:hypothetical protein
MTTPFTPPEIVVTPPSGETIRPPEVPNDPVRQPCAWAPCTNNDEVCLSCGYCLQCDWEIFGAVRCTRCNWGSDCLAALGTVSWCTTHGMCASCCDCSGVISPAGMSGGACVRRGGNCTSGVCPTCSWCANCSWVAYGNVSCSGCHQCGDCLSKTGRDWNRSGGNTRCNGC